MTDRELLELAAKAAGVSGGWREKTAEDGYPAYSCGIGDVGRLLPLWNPLTHDGDRYRLAKHLGISIDFQDCCAWKRLANGELIQEFWGGECGDEAHAVVRAAAEIGRGMQ